MFVQLQSKFTEGWWAEQFLSLAKIFHQDPHAGAAAWVELFAKALVEWDLPGCIRLTEQTYPFPGSLSFVPLMFRSGIEGLEQGKPNEAGDMLTFILEPIGFQNPPQIDPQTQADVMVLQGRIADHDGNPELAAALFNQAASLVPQNGIPQSGLGWLKMQNKLDDEAATLFKAAVSLSPDQPEGHVGLAVLLDTQGVYDEAKAWYLRAVDCAMRNPDPLRDVERLMAPTSGNLYYYLADALKEISVHAALAAVDQALASNLMNASAYPEVQAYELKAQLLSSLRKRIDAANAYFEAGRRAGWNGDFGGAVDLLKRAEKLDKKSQEIYLSLSENLRMHSYDLQDSTQRDKMVVDSLAAWEGGARLGPFTPELSWALLTRALMNEVRPELAAAPVSLVDLYGWEALYYIERALLLNESDIYSWIFLGRIYRQLNMRENYRFSLDKAAEHNPEDVGLIEERAIMCANDGDQVQAKILLNKLLKQEGYPSVSWARSAYGFALSRQGKYAQALKYTETGSEFVWVNFYRALCFTRLDQNDLALEEYQAIWKKRSKKRLEDYGSFGQAALFIALIDPKQHKLLTQAASYLEQAFENKTDPFNHRFFLGCCRLVQGEDRNAAKQLMDEAIQAAGVPYDLKQMAELSIPDLIRFSARLPNKVQVINALEEMQQKILARKKALDKKRPSPEKEFSERQARFDQDDLSAMPVELVERSKIGVKAALARFDLKAERTGEAAETYSELLIETDLFPEAVHGLDRAIKQLGQLTLDQLGSGRYTQALKLLDKAYTYSQNLDKKEYLPGINVQTAFAYLGMADELADARDLAIQHLIEAYQAYRDQGIEDAWGTIAADLRWPIKNVEQYWKISHAMEVTIGVLKSRHLDKDDEIVGGIELVQQRMDDYLAEKYGINAPYEDIPFTFILRVEMGDGFDLPEDPNQWEMITHGIPEIRDRLIAEFGVEIPGVRFRLAPETLSPGGYRILIDDKMVKEGQVPTGEESTHALSEALHETLRQNFDRFMDVQNTMKLIQTWQKISSDDYLIINRALPDDRARREFGLALRDLAREHISTNRPDEFLPVLKGLALEGSNRSELLRRLRLAVAKSLPGNDSQYRHLQLPEDVEHDLTSYLQNWDGEVYLEIPKDAYPVILNRLDSLLKGAKKTALICRNPMLRLVLRRMVETDHPNIPVLSEEEHSLSANRNHAKRSQTGAAAHE